MTVAMLALAGTAFAAPDPAAGNPSCFGAYDRAKPQGIPGPGAGISAFTSGSGGQDVSEAAQNIGPVQRVRPCPEPTVPPSPF
jgi:hypothetical protein